MKYRGIHPSYVGVIDLNVSSNSDVGMSGSFVPTVELHDKFYFGDREPCDGLYDLYNMKYAYLKKPCKDKKKILKFMNEEELEHDIPYEKIEIIEKEP